MPPASPPAAQLTTGESIGKWGQIYFHKRGRKQCSLTKHTLLCHEPSAQLQTLLSYTGCPANRNMEGNLSRVEISEETKAVPHYLTHSPPHPLFTFQQISARTTSLSLILFPPQNSFHLSISHFNTKTSSAFVPQKNCYTMSLKYNVRFSNSCLLHHSDSYKTYNEIQSMDLK